MKMDKTYDAYKNGKCIIDKCAADRGAQNMKIKKLEKQLSFYKTNRFQKSVQMRAVAVKRAFHNYINGAKSCEVVTAVEFESVINELLYFLEDEEKKCRN